MDYSYGYVDDSAFLATLFGILGTVILVAGAVSIFMIIISWKLFKKAGKPGWASIVPFYNQYVLAEITWGNGWFFLIPLAAIIPVVGTIAVIVFSIMTNIKLAKAFGKDGGFAVGLIFLYPIFAAILAFGNSQYVGVDANLNPFSNNNNPNNNNYNNQYNNGNYQNNMNYNNNYNNQNNMNYNNQNNFQNVNQNNATMSNNINQEFTTNENQNNGPKFCTNCGTKLESYSSFCTNCGTKVN